MPMAAKASAPWSMIQGTLAYVSTLLMLVGWPQEPSTAGYGGRCAACRACPRWRPSGPSLRRRRRRRRPRRSGCRSEAAAEHVRRPAGRARAPARWRAQPLDGEGVLGAHVHVALSGADGEGGDDHAFDHQCGLPSSTERSMKAPGSPSSALQMMYLRSPAARGVNRHLRPVEKPAPPRPRRPERSIFGDDVLGVVPGQHLRQRRVAAVNQVVVDGVRVDLAVEGQHQRRCSRVERDVGLARRCARRSGSLYRSFSTTPSLTTLASTICGARLAAARAGRTRPWAGGRPSAPARRSRGSRSRRCPPSR